MYNSLNKIGIIAAESYSDFSINTWNSISSPLKNPLNSPRQSSPDYLPLPSTTLWYIHTYMFVRASLLTMANPNLLCDVLLFVCSKMADETNLSSKLPVADRTREVWGGKLYWWCLSSGFPLCTFQLGFADSFCFVFTSSPSYKASPLCSILCNLFPRLCWYVEAFVACSKSDN